MSGTPPEECDPNTLLLSSPDDDDDDDDREHGHELVTAQVGPVPIGPSCITLTLVDNSPPSKDDRNAATKSSPPPRAAPMVRTPPHRPLVGTCWCTMSDVTSRCCVL